jgi:hypothetical protein
VRPIAGISSPANENNGKGSGSSSSTLEEFGEFRFSRGIRDLEMLTYLIDHCRLQRSSRSGTAGLPRRNTIRLSLLLSLPALKPPRFALFLQPPTTLFSMAVPLDLLPLSLILLVQLSLPTTVCPSSVQLSRRNHQLRSSNRSSTLGERCLLGKERVWLEGWTGSY